MLRQTQYRTLADLNQQVRQLLPRLPRDIDLIVGIPRSGLLVANLLALYLNFPLADLDGFLAGRILASGHRGPGSVDPLAEGAQPRVLIVDDSVGHGTQMEQVRAQVAAAGLTCTIEYLAVYVTERGMAYVDYWGEVIEHPRMFEWNVMHHTFMDRFCLDIDGVLCLDPDESDNDDGERYAGFLRHATPFFLPTKKVGWLVTCRLEKYRAETEDWLHRHGVAFGELVMMQHPDQAARKAAGDYAEFKAAVYRRSGAILFVESSARQAERIAELTGKPVLCLETGQLMQPGMVASSVRLARELPTALPGILLRHVRRGCRRLLQLAPARA